MSSRRYIKRVWRVPKDRGATPYLAALVTKAMVKHGWPARWEPLPAVPGFVVLCDKERDLPPDFQAALEVAVRIAARTYRLDLTQTHGAVVFNRSYRVAAGGHFVEVRE